MNSVISHQWRPRSASSLEGDVLIKKLLLTHDLDGRRLESEQLLRVTENIMCFATTSEVLVSDIHSDAFAMDNESIIEIVGSQEPLGYTIYKISREILCKCCGEGDIHTRTMVMFDLLGNYRWDAKVVLVLAAFATSYGEFWLTMQLYPENPLAVSVAMLKQWPSSISKLKPRFRALSLLVKTMIDVTRCIIKFEGLPVAHVIPDFQIISATKSQIFFAAYWITRSTLVCSSSIKDLIAMKPEQVHIFSLSKNYLVYSNSTIAAWELSSLVYRLSGIYSHLRRQVDECHRHIEMKMYQKLIDTFKDKESHTDNQEVLGLLFALKNDLPLKNCPTQAKLGVSELKDKVVILLVSKPELLPLEELFLLVHQTYDHPHSKNLEGSYEIVWVPISFSDTWTNAEKESFDLLSNYLPWFSVWQPQSLDSAVVKFIKQEWKFKDEPIMVVLEFKRDVSKEIQLWEKENWTLQLMIDEIDPQLAKWVEEGRNICLYGSDNLHWIRKFSAKINEIKGNGLQLDVVYVGKKNPSEQVGNILTVINEEMHTNFVLSFTKIQFFWFRLESMRRSKLRLGKMADDDHILREVSALLTTDDGDNGWAVIGKGLSSEIIWVQGSKLMEYLNRFPEWGENVAKLGLIDAIIYAVEPPDLTAHCSHSKLIPYADGDGSIVVCQNCKRLFQKFVVYE
ncbi:hypothetical protein Patl1_15995 [Pistacia atlantica]|uniref:Uncharacterized protein n=1 Tax=Pistacia atlantica TaxID=434234 RepID=A0ACC1B7R1_9ROSI|nr:hypothetical protein Patl1_15995 [Pistacia atlantica]